MRAFFFLSMRHQNRGIPYSATRIAAGLARRGLRCEFYVTASDVAAEDLGADGIVLRRALPRWIRGGAYHRLSPVGVRLNMARLSARVGPDDLVFLWYTGSAWLHTTLGARGVPLFHDGVSCLKAHARPILDAVYDREGLPPAHGITDAVIARETYKLSHLTGFFSTSPLVDRSLEDSDLTRSAILRSSHGVDPRWFGGDDAPAPVPSGRGSGFRLLFVGRGDLRKGTHHLLRAWARADIAGDLILAGGLAPEVEALCAGELRRPNVTVLPFVPAIEAEYRKADAFVINSYIEGDAKVTYEAAACGLPLITTPAGAGRIGHSDTISLMVPPGDEEALGAAITQLAGDSDLRQELGERARAAAHRFKWDTVAGQRLDQMKSLLPGHPWP